MGLVLPTTKVPATSTNPQYLILYGLPKAGKTSALAQLEGNLIIDLEGGSKFIDALAIQARTINDLGEIAQEITPLVSKTSVWGMHVLYIVRLNLARTGKEMM